VAASLVFAAVIGLTANLVRTTSAALPATQQPQLSDPGEKREAIQPKASTQWRATLVAAQRCIDSYRFGDAVSLFQMFRAANAETTESALVRRLIRRTEKMADKHSQIRMARAERLIHRGDRKAGIAMYQKIVKDWGLERYVSEARKRLKELGE
jgi:hypothetical protein